MSVLLAIASGFGAASVSVIVSSGWRRRLPASVTLMVLAIVGLHFTGVSALRITPLLIEPAKSFSEAVAALALAIVAMTALIVAAGALSYSLDESARADAFQRIRVMALHDGLTGLPNRTLFHEQLDRFVAEASAKGSSVALAIFDLDGFKDVNDQYGHVAGDVLLKRLP